jgi:hypothetical protein
MIRLVFAGYPVVGHTAMLAVRPELSHSKFAGMNMVKIIPHISNEGSPYRRTPLDKFMLDQFMALRMAQTKPQSSLATAVIAT